MKIIHRACISTLLVLLLLSLSACGSSSSSSSTPSESFSGRSGSSAGQDVGAVSEGTDEEEQHEKQGHYYFTVNNGDGSVTACNWTYDRFLEDSPEHGWILLSVYGKGYNTPYMAFNPDLGIAIEGSEAAPVYLGSDGIIQLQLQQGGVPASPKDMEDAVGESYDVIARYYSWDGTLQEELFLYTYCPQDSDTSHVAYELEKKYMDEHGARYEFVVDWGYPDSYLLDYAADSSVVTDDGEFTVSWSGNSTTIRQNH